MIRTLLLTAILGLVGLATATAQNHTVHDGFLQGPENPGHTRDLAGVVIGVQHYIGGDCYILQADLPGENMRGRGGGGRFFLCKSEGLSLALGDYWVGTGTHTGTRRHRMGARWRVLPLFVSTDSLQENQEKTP